MTDRVALLYRGEGAGAQLDRGTSAVWSENFLRVRVVRTEKGRDGIQLLQASGAARCARERWKFSSELIVHRWQRHPRPACAIHLLRGADPRAKRRQTLSRPYQCISYSLECSFLPQAAPDTVIGVEKRLSSSIEGGCWNKNVSYGTCNFAECYHVEVR